MGRALCTRPLLAGFCLLFYSLERTVAEKGGRLKEM